MPACWRSPAPGCCGVSSLSGGKALYALSEKGAQLAGVPLRGPRRRQNETLVADFFVEHQLAINDVYCALKFGAIPVAGVSFRRWLAFHEPITEELRLIPDGYVELATPTGDARGISRSRSRTRTGARMEGKAQALFATGALRRIRTAVRPESLPGARPRELSSAGCIRSGRRSGRSRKRSSGSQRSKQFVIKDSSLPCGIGPRAKHPQHLIEERP